MWGFERGLVVRAYGWRGFALYLSCILVSSTVGTANQYSGKHILA